MSHGLKMASANLEDQTLHLTVRLQAGDDEEEEQDEEIGGLINSDGEVVEWDASKYLHYNSMFSAKAQLMQVFLKQDLLNLWKLLYRAIVLSSLCDFIMFMGEHTLQV